MLFRNKRPKLLAIARVHCVHIAVIGGCEDDEVRIGFGAAINDRSRLRVQRIAHDTAYGRVRIEIDVSDIFATRKADQVRKRRFVRRSRQAKNGGIERVFVRQRNRVCAGRQVRIRRVVGVHITHGGIRQVFDSTAEIDVGTVCSG